MNEERRRARNHGDIALLEERLHEIEALLGRNIMEREALEQALAKARAELERAQRDSGLPQSSPD